MRHVDHQIGADPVGDRAKPGEIDDPRIGAAAGDDQFRPMRLGEPALDLVEIDLRVLGADAIADRVEPFARQVGASRRASDGRRRRATCREWCRPADSKARNTAWFACAPACGWTLAKRAAKEPSGAVDRQRFGDIDKFAPAVIAAAGIAFGVFVGQHRALRFEHRARRRCSRWRSARSAIAVDRVPARSPPPVRDRPGATGRERNPRLRADAGTERLRPSRDHSSGQENRRVAGLCDSGIAKSAAAAGYLPDLARQFQRATRNRSIGKSRQTDFAAAGGLTLPTENYGYRDALFQQRLGATGLC